VEKVDGEKAAKTDHNKARRNMVKLSAERGKK